MDSGLYNLAYNHSLAFVVAAAVICTMSAWLLLSLLERARANRGMRRYRWMAAVAAVGGLGIWATHFIAMLGFRPDFVFSYDPRVTALSAFLGVVLFGIPISFVSLTDRRLFHAIIGGLGGAGVATMHFTGMGALQGCLVSQATSTCILSTALGIGFLSGAMFIQNRRRHNWLRVLLIVLAVCSVHFVALLGLSLQPLHDAQIAGVDHVTLGAVLTTVALCLFITAASSAVSSAKLDEQARQGALLGAALNNMSNGLIVVGPNGRISLLNERLYKLFGIGPGQATVGMRWQEYLTSLGAHLGWDAARLGNVIANHASWFEKLSTTYLEHELADGRVISVACRPTEGGGAVLTYDDVTVERLALKATERLAFIDPLTVLPNRRALQNEMDAALTAGAQIALLLIDLDRFKAINDTLGHAVGDEVLIVVANRLQAMCSGDEFVARMGGDVLAVVTRRRGDPEVARLAALLVAEVGIPFLVHGHSLTIGCCVGTASTIDACDPATLVRYADLALMKAKTKGGSQSHRYESGMQEAAVERSRIESDLALALEGSQFALHYQPLCGLPDRKIMGFEALIRWNHPERGFISPDRFIPIAEETGIIREIGAWVLLEACRQAANWPSDIHVAVNVSPVQLRDGNFALRVAKVLSECGLSPARLEIELTETALVSDGAEIAMSLKALRDLGIKISMDDFGTGYSSFAHLVDFDLDRIKIDRSFVQAALEKPSALAVVKAVIQMAHDLGVKTIGEGVEKIEQLELLERLECDAAQGYYLGRPMKESNVAANLAPRDALLSA